MICTVFCNTWTWRRRRMEAKRPPSMTSRGRSYVWEARSPSPISLRHSATHQWWPKSISANRSYPHSWLFSTPRLKSSLRPLPFSSTIIVCEPVWVNECLTPWLFHASPWPALDPSPVTQELSQAVATAQYPTNPTVVKKCVVASNSHRLSEGMEIVDFRQVALQHYTAFRTLAESHWSVFIFATEMGA